MAWDVQHRRYEIASMIRQLESRDQQSEIKQTWLSVFIRLFLHGVISSASFPLFFRFEGKFKREEKENEMEFAS